MSIQAMNWALHQDVKPAAAKLLLIVLANYADDRDTAWPSKARLATDCSLDKSGICRHLATLEEQGFISVTKRADDGANLTSLVRLNRDRNSGRTDATTDGETTSRADATTLSHQRTEGSRASASGVVAPVRHKPSKEPSEVTTTNREHEPNGRTDDGGGSVQIDVKAFVERIALEVGIDETKQPGLIALHSPSMWIAVYRNPELIIQSIKAVVAKNRAKFPGWSPSTWGYFDQALARDFAAGGASAQIARKAKATADETGLREIRAIVGTARKAPAMPAIETWGA